jgi:Tol biopolymer transport system component
MLPPRVRATGSEPFASLTKLTALSTPGYDGGPWINATGLVLYWHSDGGTSRELYVAERATAADAFGPAMPMADVNSPDNEQDPWVSSDGHTIVFVSNRNTGNYDLYMATR